MKKLAYGLILAALTIGAVEFFTSTEDKGGSITSLFDASSGDSATQSLRQEQPIFVEAVKVENPDEVEKEIESQMEQARKEVELLPKSQMQARDRQLSSSEIGQEQVTPVSSDVGIDSVASSPEIPLESE